MKEMDCAVSNRDINGKVRKGTSKHCMKGKDPSFAERNHVSQAVSHSRSTATEHGLQLSTPATVPLQRVVVIGGGAFACEAMRSAVWNGAASVTMLTREKSK